MATVDALGGRVRRAPWPRAAPRSCGRAPEPTQGRSAGFDQHVSRPDAARDGATDGRVGSGLGIRVLLVEDDPSMRMICTLNLEAAGFEVTEAASGAEALDRVAQGSFHLVLLDVMLPDIGGHDVGRRLRGVPVAYVSARARRDDQLAGYELGAVDYITKPFDPTALPDRVREIVRRVERGESERFRLERLAELRG